MKKTLCILLVSVMCLTLVLSGCGAVDASKLKAGLITSSLGLEDSYNSLVWSGLEKFAEESKLTIINGIADDMTAATEVITSFLAEDCNIVINCNEHINSNIVTLAASYPDTTFVLLNGVIETDAPNVVVAITKSEDAGFIAGYLATYKASGSQLAFIGGQQGDTTGTFYDGFRAGISEAGKSGATMPALETGFAGAIPQEKSVTSFSERMFKNTDVLTTSLTGSAVTTAINTAKSIGADKNVIAFDTAASKDATDNTLFSLTRADDAVVYDIVKGICKGDIKGGSTQYYGYAEGKIAFDKAAAEKNIGKEAVDSLMKALDMVKSGEIKLVDRQVQ